MNEEWLLAERPWMGRLATALVTDAHVRDDVVQETLRIALERSPRERTPGALRGWLRTVMANLVRQEHRSAGARRWHETKIVRERESATRDLDDRLELETHLSQALRSLPDPYREAVVLRYLDGLSPRQIARRQGVSVAAAGQRISRGLARLRERLDTDFGERGRWRAVCLSWLAGSSPTKQAGILTMTTKLKLIAGTVAAGLGTLLLWSPATALLSASTSYEPLSIAVAPVLLSAPAETRTPIPPPERKGVEGIAPMSQVEETAAALSTDVASEVEAYLRPLVDAKLFSGSVLLARGGEVVLSEAYGLAHAHGKVANTTETRYKLMSVTKPVTAVAVMTLHQAGRLDISDPVARYVDPWPEGWQGVTLEELLSHTSKIPNLEREWVTMLNDTRLRGISLWPKLMATLEANGLTSPASSPTGYSNFNFVLLGFVIEAVTSVGYEKYLTDAVLRPVEMKQTGCDFGRKFNALATGYFRGPGGVPDPSNQDMSRILPAGGLYSSTLDLYRLDRALYTNDLLKAETRERMFSPVSDYYACGWNVMDRLGRSCIQHSGGANGYVAEFLRFPEDEACVIVLSNFAFAPVGRIADDLGSILFGEDHESPALPTSEILDEAEGVCRAPGAPGVTLFVRRSGSTLLVFSVRGNENRCGGDLLFPTEGEFLPPWGIGRLRFQPGDEDGIETVRYHSGIVPLQWERQADASEAWSSAVGKYEASPRLGKSVEIVRTRGGLEMRIEQGWPEVLELALLDENRAIAMPSESFGTMLRLERDGDGTVRGFTWERADGETFSGTRKPD